MSAVLRRPAYICPRCLRHSRRQYSSSSPPPPPPPPSGATPLSTRRLISIHGPDYPKFLQGITTTSIHAESPTGHYAAFLNAQGRIIRDVFIYPSNTSSWHKDVNKDDDPGYILEADGENIDAFLKHVKKHKLRSKFKVRLVEEGELGIWAVWKEGERWTAHGKQSGSAIRKEGVMGLSDLRAPGMGQRVLIPDGVKIEDVVGEVEQATEQAYRLRRYLRGVPEGLREMPAEDSLPMNFNVDLMGGIDFKKGCYIGQELTIRTHHTGVVRRRVLPVVLFEHGLEPPAALEYDPEFDASLQNVDIRRDDKRRRPTGKLIANVGNVGLGMCRLEQMSDLVISGEGSSFTPDDRFLITADATGRNDVGVKAFVPDWLRGRVREPKLQKRVSD